MTVGRDSRVLLINIQYPCKAAGQPVLNDFEIAMNQHTPRDIASFPELFEGFDDITHGLRRFTTALCVIMGIPCALLSLYAVVTGV